MGLDWFLVDWTSMDTGDQLIQMEQDISRYFKVSKVARDISVETYLGTKYLGIVRRPQGARVPAPV